MTDSELPGVGRSGGSSIMRRNHRERYGGLPYYKWDQGTRRFSRFLKAMAAKELSAAEPQPKR